MCVAISKVNLSFKRRSKLDVLPTYSLTHSTTSVMSYKQSLDVECIKDHQQITLLLCSADTVLSIKITTKKVS